MAKKPDTRHAQIGGRKRALSRYSMIKHRVENTHLPKNRGYVGVELRVDKETFVAWFMERDFKGCSVDRIDVSGHYELENMQVVSLAWNIARDKLKHVDGFCVCYACGQSKPSEAFAVDKRRLHTGRSTICKSCDGSRPKNVSQEARNRTNKKQRDAYHARKAATIERLDLFS